MSRLYGITTHAEANTLPTRSGRVVRATLNELLPTKSARAEFYRALAALSLERITKIAITVLGSATAAEEFLSRRHQLLEGRTPREVIRETFGGEDRVEEILRKAQFGVAL